MGYVELQLEWYYLTINAVAVRISEERVLQIDSERLERAIAEKNEYSQNLQVFWHVLDNGLKIYDELIDFTFDSLLGEISLNEELCIYPNCFPQYLYEKQIKVKGQIWELHKNDIDPFPSNPHAHNYETGLKLDLSNGRLYKKKRFVDAVNMKKLLTIRKKIQNAGFSVPELTI